MRTDYVLIDFENVQPEAREALDHEHLASGGPRRMTSATLQFVADAHRAWTGFVG